MIAMLSNSVFILEHGKHFSLSSYRLLLTVMGNTQVWLNDKCDSASSFWPSWQSLVISFKNNWSLISKKRVFSEIGPRGNGPSHVSKNLGTAFKDSAFAQH